MKKIIIAAFKQETSTFNPSPTNRTQFEKVTGDDILGLRDSDSEIGGALKVFEATNVKVVPTHATWAVSGGPITELDLNFISKEFLQSIFNAEKVDGALIVFHGAMAGESEFDPEGRVLEAIRRHLGKIPIVTTFDLHGILTDSLIDNTDVIVPFHTYPHVDQFETGERAANCLLHLLEHKMETHIDRIKLPMLVRGDELLTETGIFGKAIELCKELEKNENVLSSGIFIGNPFTDVPDLCSNVVITHINTRSWAHEQIGKIATYMWENRKKFVAELTPINEAIKIADASEGLTVFSDAADAPSSGASGDSNSVFKAIIENRYQGTALIPIVDAPAVKKAFANGIGSEIVVSIGGSLDPDRHTPYECRMYVKALNDGNFVYNDGLRGHAGPTAVLVYSNYTLMVTSVPVNIMDQHVFLACGLIPENFDLVVCKSPNGFRPHYETIAKKIIPVDLPGSTSANLNSLPYSRCYRPIFPLDADVQWPNNTSQ